MSRTMNKMMWSAAVVAGLGTLGAVGMLGMQSMQGSRSKGSCGCGHGHGHNMMSRVSDMGDEFADEFCSMAHKTGNAMIRAGRMINRMVP